MSTQRSRFDLKLWSIILLAAILRLYDIGGESLWIDEGQTVTYAVKSFEEIVKYCARDVHPPLYLFILHGWTELFGISEAALRFPSALFGIVSVWLTYALGHRLIGRNGALWGALFMAVSYMGINFSQEARSYTMLLAAILMSCHALLLYLDERTRNRTLYYAASVALMLYTHTFTVFIIFFHQLFFLFSLEWRSVRLWRTIGAWIGVNILALILFSPWMYFLLKQVLAKLGGEGPGSWVPVPDLDVAYRTFIQLAGGFIPLIITAIAVIAFLTVNLIPSLRAKHPTQNTSGHASIFLGLWFLGAVATPFALSLLLTPIYVERYAIQFLPGFCLFLGMLIAGLSPAILGYAVAAVFMAGTAHGLWNYYSMLDKEQWRDVAQFIEENIQPGQAIVLSAPWIYEPFTYYFGDDGKPRIIQAFDFVNVKQEVEGVDGVWLIQAHEFFSDPDGKIPMQLAEDRLIKKHKDFKEGIKTNPILVHFQSIRATFYDSGQASEFLKKGLSVEKGNSLIPGLPDAWITERAGFKTGHDQGQITLTTGPDTRLKYRLQNEGKLGEGALSLWFRPKWGEEKANKRMIVMAKGPKWDRNTLFIETTPVNGIRAILFGNDGFLNMAEGAPLPIATDRWHHIIISWDRENLSLFLDGQSYASAQLPRPFQADFRTLHLGADHQNSFPAPGLYDDLAMHSSPIDLKAAKDIHTGNTGLTSVIYWYDLDQSGVRNESTSGEKGILSGADSFFLTTVPEIADNGFTKGSVSFGFVPHWNGNDEKQRVLLALLGKAWNMGSIFVEKTPSGFLQAIRWEQGAISAVTGLDITSWKEGSNHTLQLSWTKSTLELAVDGKQYGKKCDPPATDSFKSISIANDSSFTLPANGEYKGTIFAR